MIGPRSEPDGCCCRHRSRSPLGSDDESSEGQNLQLLVRLQRLLGQQEAVVQHVQPLQEVGVDVHLQQEPGALLGCTEGTPRGHRGDTDEWENPGGGSAGGAGSSPRVMYWPSKLRSLRTTTCWLPSGAGSVQRLTSQPLMSYLSDSTATANQQSDC